MYCHCVTNNRAPRWTFTDPCKPEVRPGAREESALNLIKYKAKMNSGGIIAGQNRGLISKDLFNMNPPSEKVVEESWKVVPVNCFTT